MSTTRRKRIRRISLRMSPILVVFMLLSSNSYTWKAIWYNTPGLEDYKWMPKREVKAANPQPWEFAADYNQKHIPDSLMQIFGKTGTHAYLVIKDDKVVQEWYAPNYSDSSRTNIFSVTKSIASILTGIAIKEGKIKSVNEPIWHYYPPYKDGGRENITFRDLLMMSSGLDWVDNYYNPFSNVADLYYGDNLRGLFEDVSMKEKPGTHSIYKNCDTEILTLALEKAVGMNMSEYASEKLWKPLGAEHSAYWLTDRHNGMEKTFCCFNTNARDLARIGQLYLHEGNWNGQQIVDSAYVRASYSDTTLIEEARKELPKRHYGYMWWVHDELPYFHYAAEGMQGQYVVVIPEKNMVIVRLGQEWGERLDIKSKGRGRCRLYYSMVETAIAQFGS